MPVNTREFLNAIAVLTDERNMRVTLKQSAKGAILCGATCFIGGVILGPVGLAAGGIVGGLAASQMTKGTFRPVGDIIRNELTDRQREKLIGHIMLAVRDFQVTDIVILLPLLMGNPSIQNDVIKGVVTFFTNDMRLQLVD